MPSEAINSHHLTSTHSIKAALSFNDGRNPHRTSKNRTVRGFPSLTQTDTKHFRFIKPGHIRRHQVAGQQNTRFLNVDGIRRYACHFDHNLACDIMHICFAFPHVLTFCLAKLFGQRLQ